MEAARRLRRVGWSLREIATHLEVSLGRTSEWVRDITLEQRAAAPDDPPLPQALPVWKSGQVARCPRCGFTLPIELFSRLGDGRQWWCRRCFIGYHQGRRPQARARASARVDAARAFVLEHLSTHPCADCGLADPVVLEFDHVASKHSIVSALVARGAPLARLEAEISRCEAVCVNCHRRRSARRSGSRRLGGAVGGSQARPLRERNLRHLFDRLRSSGCIDCGERDLVVLDFDHLGEKVANVSRMAHREWSLARIDAEIAKCEVRCANCHRRRTARELGYYRHLAVQAEVDAEAA